MKFRSHLYRMNPQAIQRPTRAPRISTILAVVLFLTAGALYWIGKYYNP